MRRFMRELRLVLSVAVLLVGLGEVSLRSCPSWLFPEEIRQWLMAHHSLGHPALGAMERPHSPGVFIGRDFRVPYQTDSQGFYNVWPWPDTAEVVVLGDAMTLGYGVEAQQAWPALVARAVAPNRLLNLALLDAGPRQYARAYELFGTARHPKVLLVGLSLTDDLHDAVLFARWQRGKAGGNYRVWRASGGITGYWTNPFSLLHAWLARHSLLYQLGRVALLDERTETQVVWLPGGQYLQLWPKRFQAVLAQTQPEHEAVGRVLDALAYLQVIARAYGTQVIVVFLPSKEEVYLSPRGETPLDPGRALREGVQQRGMITLDLAPLLRQWGTKGEPLFYAVSPYLNEQGHALVARAVLQHLASVAYNYALRPWGTGRPGTPEASLWTP
ncbi:MAG: hypothetical protein AB7N91_20665 [Candidatus Tectimicrobiota bacterium]